MADYPNITPEQLKQITKKAFQGGRIPEKGEIRKMIDEQAAENNAREERAHQRELEVEERKAQRQREAEERKYVAEQERRAQQLEVEREKTKRQREMAQQRAEREAVARRAAARKAEEARIRTAHPVTIPISPSAAQVQARRASPFESVLEGGGFWQSVGANLAGTAAVALMTTILPAPRKAWGPAMGGIVGAVATLTSPIGTWISEAGGGAYSAGLTYGLLYLFNRYKIGQSATASAATVNEVALPARRQQPIQPEAPAPASPGGDSGEWAMPWSPLYSSE